MGEIKAFSVTVEGFSPVTYCARSPAKARARCWRAFTASHTCTFRRFLEISTISRIENQPGVGDRVLIAGLPATRVIDGGGQYVAYMRDDKDEIFYSHPLDVTALPKDGA